MGASGGKWWQEDEVGGAAAPHAREVSGHRHRREAEGDRFQTEAATGASRAAQRLPVVTDPPAHAHCSRTRNKNESISFQKASCF